MSSPAKVVWWIRWNWESRWWAVVLWFHCLNLLHNCQRESLSGNDAREVCYGFDRLWLAVFSQLSTGGFLVRGSSWWMAPPPENDLGCYLEARLKTSWWQTWAGEGLLWSTTRGFLRNVTASWCWGLLHNTIIDDTSTSTQRIPSHLMEYSAWTEYKLSARCDLMVRECFIGRQSHIHLTWI